MTFIQFPPYVVVISLIRAAYLALFGKVHFIKDFIGKTVQMNDGQTFTIFRHITVNSKKPFPDVSPTVFRVGFKFAALSNKANKKASLIPIPLIISSHGFRSKIWMLNKKTGYWQGIYQWDSEKSVEEYKKSFVLGVMNKRAIAESITYEVIPATTISEYINRHLYENAIPEAAP